MVLAFWMKDRTRTSDPANPAVSRSGPASVKPAGRRVACPSVLSARASAFPRRALALHGLLILMAMAPAAMAAAARDPGTTAATTQSLPRLMPVAAEVQPPLNEPTTVPAAAAVAAPPAPAPAAAGAPDAGAPVPAGAATPAAPEPPVAAQIYRALEHDEKADLLGRLLSILMKESGQRCRRITEYQLFRVGPDYQTVKVKCRGVPLYAVTVMRNGGSRIAGGDGQVGEMAPADGRIFTIMGERFDSYMARERAAEVERDRSLPNDMATAESGAPSFWRRHSSMLILGANFILIALLALVLYRMGRTDRSPHGQDSSYLRDLSSEEKDSLVAQAREIQPNIYRHPEGFFIARGPSGRRRLFWDKTWARMYRDFGIKWGEIR